MAKRTRITVAKLKLGKREFVIISQRDFDRLRGESEQYRRIVAEDRALGKLAERELRKYRKTGKAKTLEQVKKELGL